MAPLWLQNLGSYSLQIAAIILAGAALIELLRVHQPIWRLRLWQALLAICLLLPFVQPWKSGTSAGSVTVSSTSVAVSGVSHMAKPGVPFSKIVAFVLLAGIVVRLAYLALGFWRLRRYRSESRPAAEAALGIQARMGITAEIRVLESLPGPVTFGVFRPVIVVPPRWIGNASILCHELIHVRRHDWLATAFEEFIRAVFWFHPFVWWAIAKIQLAREEVVDREAVHHLDNRQPYLETLLEIAAAQAGLPLAPAPLFLRNRHLRQRVASLMKEAYMSRQRLNLSLAGFSAAILTAGWLAVHSFPLQAAPQQQAGSTLEISGLRPTHKVAPRYPDSAKDNHVEGAVGVRIQVDQHGLVADAQAISGPEELRPAALVAVRQWTFATDSPLPASADVAINFRLEPDQAEPLQPMQNGRPQRIRVGGNVMPANLIAKVTPKYPVQAKLDRVQGVVKLNVLIGEDGHVEDVVLIEGHPLLTDAAMQAVQQWVYQPTLLNGQPIEVLTQVDVNFTLLP